MAQLGRVSLAAKPDDGGYQVRNIPFFAKGIAFGDVVAAHQTEAGWYRFDRVVQHSGRSAFRIWMKEASSVTVKTVCEEIRRLGGQTEVTLDRLVGIDVGPNEEPTVWEHLEAGLQRGDWEIQIGYSPE
jgi:Domain of unknown function (DUF4265)